MRPTLGRAIRDDAYMDVDARIRQGHVFKGATPKADAVKQSHYPPLTDEGEKPVIV
jgi:hypothetical protein